MKEITRYESGHDDMDRDCYDGCRVREDGPLVSYEDHAAIVAALQEQVRALASEGSAIKQAFKQAANTVEEYEIYGDLKYAVEPSEYEALADAIEETPNTDVALREIRAQAVDGFAKEVRGGHAEADRLKYLARHYAAAIRSGEQS